METSLNGQGIIAEKLLDIQVHNTAIFPAATNLTCTLTAATDANVFGDWTEVVDSGAASLSTPFASKSGHIAALIIESCSEASKHYMFELSYGASHVHIGAWAIVSESNNIPVAQSPRCRCVHIPAGETIYYRAMCETATNKTVTCHIRYFLH